MILENLKLTPWTAEYNDLWVRYLIADGFHLNQIEKERYRVSKILCTRKNGISEWHCEVLQPTFIYYFDNNYNNLYKHLENLKKLNNYSINQKFFLRKIDAQRYIDSLFKEHGFFLLEKRHMNLL